MADRTRWRYYKMLKKFEVENFKGFEERLVFDLTARDYAFNSELAQNGIVNKALIYGKNGIGKSNLGIAIFDIISHLTDKERMPDNYVENYLNLNSVNRPACFVYVFRFGDDEIIYSYSKKSRDDLIRETLQVNGEVVLDYDYFDENTRFISPDLIGTLNVDLVDNKLSVIKYIYRNTPTNPSSAITQMVQFCENMLWYRSLSEGTDYSGFQNGNNILAETLYQTGKLREFGDFLRENGLEYKLKFESVNGKHELMALYHNDENKVPFESIASTGTRALYLFFIWKITAFSKVSFLFIDEFDAFLHYETAEYMVRNLNKERNFQTMLTTHHTYLMQNKLTRPDCCFIMTENKISSVYNASDREIREAHNLEKMYIGGAFNRRVR